MSDDNPRIRLNKWMSEHQALLVFGPSLLFAAIGLLVGAGLGAYFVDFQAGMGMALTGGFFGMLTGPFFFALPMTVLWIGLMICFPSRRVYLPIAGLVGLIIACIQGALSGYSPADWLVAAIADALLALIVCETFHGIGTRL